jgi:transposase
MTQEQLFSSALMVEQPWFITDIQFNSTKGRLDIYIDFERGSSFHYENPAEQIKGNFKVYDAVKKTWRHLNFFQFECYLHAYVPRLDIGGGKARLTTTPWEGKVPGFTLLMEAFILQFAKHMPVHQVGKLIKVSDNRIWRLLKRYVDLARAQQDFSDLTHFGVDETAILRGHNYVSLFVDLIERKTVFVTEGKGQETLEAFSTEVIAKKGQADNIQVISQDMSPAFQAGAKAFFPKAKIVFDRFHLMKMVNQALDTVRKSEARTNPVLKKSRMSLLKNEENLTKTQKEKLEEIKMQDVELKTARAWRMKCRFQELYSAESKTEFELELNKWVSWVLHSNVVPMKEVARTIKRHWEGVVNWIIFGVSNGILEGMNSVFQAAKAKARGYGTISTIKTIIYLLTAKLDFQQVNSALPI